MKSASVSGFPRPLVADAARPRSKRASFSMSSAEAAMDNFVREEWWGKMDRVNGGGRFRDRLRAALAAKAYRGPSFRGGRSGIE